MRLDLFFVSNAIHLEREPVPQFERPGLARSNALDSARLTSTGTIARR